MACLLEGPAGLVRKKILPPSEAHTCNSIVHAFSKVNLVFYQVGISINAQHVLRNVTEIRFKEDISVWNVSVAFMFGALLNASTIKNKRRV